MLRNCCHIPELFSYSSPVAVATRLLSEDSTALKEEVKKMKREIELLGAENEDLALSRSDLPRKRSSQRKGRKSCPSCWNLCVVSIVYLMYNWNDSLDLISS